MNYSALIRTKNSEKTIEKTIKSLINQIKPPNEIIIVDSGSSDDTLNIVSKYDIVLIHYPNSIKFNYSKALNIGIENSKCEYVLILSSHVEFTNIYSTYLMWKTIEISSNCVAVSLSRFEDKYERNQKDIEHIEHIEHIEKKVYNIGNFQGKAMYNFCSLIKKKSWDEYRFNEELARCEDQEWVFYFLNKGFTAEIFLNLKVYYSNPYYNLNKEALEFITIGKTVYPYFVSYSFMKKMCLKSLKSFIVGNIENFKKFGLIAFYIFKYKVFGFHSKNSIYNKNLQ